MRVLELTIRRFEACCLRLQRAILLVFCATAAFSLVAPTVALAQTATWRETVGTLRIGFVTTGNDEIARRRMEPFRRALARTTGLNVVLSPVASLGQLINLQANRRLQYAIHSASSFVTLDQACKCVEAVAVPRDQEGALGVFAVLLAPRDGAVRSLSDLKGR
ncbi:MAG: PhnD/SsuA/transferrin family substrate-binding protein, partial [Pseudomonadota bacterium]